MSKAQTEALLQNALACGARTTRHKSRREPISISAAELQAVLNHLIADPATNPSGEGSEEAVPSFAKRLNRAWLPIDVFVNALFASKTKLLSWKNMQIGAYDVRLRAPGSSGAISDSATAFALQRRSRARLLSSRRAAAAAASAAGQGASMMERIGSYSTRSARRQSTRRSWDPAQTVRSSCPDAELSLEFVHGYGPYRPRSEPVL